MSSDLITVKPTKLVFGGQALAELPDGRKVFIWNALPGETLKVRLINQKRSYAEALTEEVVVASPARRVPKETNYLATSPWQMMSFVAENKYKPAIIQELFAHEKITLPRLEPMQHDKREWHYRNKMEYSFWGDDAGLHLALHQRASHGKQAVSGCVLALPAIDLAANALCSQLSSLQARAGDLKTIVVRANQDGRAVASLYTKLEKFRKLTLPPELKGLRVYYSNPKSPASVGTRLLYELGDVTLEDRLLDTPFLYDVDSFFQVNATVFERALQSIKTHCNAPKLIDMYAGVGSIGLSIAHDEVTLVEIDPDTAAMARKNAERSALQATVIESSSEAAINYIASDRPVIFDPPRAGLHERVTDQVLKVLPPTVVYLSCNPSTQARDIAKLQAAYKVEHFEIYNFFPHTPHIETLAILRML